MPQRTNQFQKLVLLVKQHLAGNATVTESKFLPDKDTGKPVEVDVCIETKIAGTDAIVCVECTKRGRRANLAWVNEMIAKHQPLPTSILVLASGSGFVRDAIKRANANRVQLISLGDVTKAKVRGLLGEIEQLWLKTFWVTAGKVVCSVEPPEGGPIKRVKTVPENLVFLNRKQVTTVHALVMGLLRSKFCMDGFATKFTLEHKFFVVEWTPKAIDGHYLCLQEQPSLEFHRIHMFKVTGPCGSAMSQIVMNHGSLDGVEVSWGEGKLFNEDALLVKTTDEKGIERVSLSTEKFTSEPSELDPAFLKHTEPHGPP